MPHRPLSRTFVAVSMIFMGLFTAGCPTTSSVAPGGGNASKSGSEINPEAISYIENSITKIAFDPESGQRMHSVDGRWQIKSGDSYNIRKIYQAERVYLGEGTFDKFSAFRTLPYIGKGIDRTIIKWPDQGKNPPATESVAGGSRAAGDEPALVR